VIRNIPVIGFLWKLAPVLFLVGGVLWLLGFRPPGVETPRPPTACASSSATPKEVTSEAWQGYECKTKSGAKDWSQCLSRSAYTSNAQRGCPGAQRCCP